LVAVFTKFDGQIIQESEKLNDMDNAVKWDKARENAEITFQRVYLPKVFGTQYPPKAYVCLGGGDHEYYARNTHNTSTDMDMSENDCPELAEKTADAIDNASLQELFISTQMNNLDLCGKAGVK
jgi:hypothetical protein